MEIIYLNIHSVFQVLLSAGLAVLLAFTLTPLVSHILYRYKLGKQIRQTAISGEKATHFYQLHKDKSGTPTMGGVIIWLTVLIITLLFNLSRQQTYLPLFALVAAGLIGLVDDLLNIFGVGANQGGLRFRHKLWWYILIAAVGAWWFYYKLDWNVIHIPGGNLFGLPYNLEIGLWYIPLFIIVMIGTAFAVNEADGLDGLAAGLLSSSFGAFAVIALIQGKVELAAFCGAVLGALLAFLWFNIYPARFFMGDTGSMSLGVTLAVVALLTNSVVVLPIIGLVFVVEAASAIIQIISKRYFGRKIWLSAPIHHHFQAKGWPETKVTMRFWVIGAVFAIIGLVIALLGQG